MFMWKEYLKAMQIKMVVGKTNHGDGGGYGEQHRNGHNPQLDGNKLVFHARPPVLPVFFRTTPLFLLLFYSIARRIVKKAAGQKRKPYNFYRFSDRKYIFFIAGFSGSEKNIKIIDQMLFLTVISGIRNFQIIILLLNMHQY